MSPRLMQLALIAWLLLALASGLDAASFPPEWRFRTLTGSHVRVHYPEGYERTARRSLSLAEEILAEHQLRYGTRIGRVEVLVTDEDDAPNGLASPLPYPFVRILAAAPGADDGLGNNEGWLRLVLTHELAHIVHLEQARGILGFGRKLFGRAPFLFPNTLSPTWLIEGLATHEETRGTAFGRGRDPDAAMLRRTAALADRFPGEDRPVAGLDAWPGGQAAYVFGVGFLQDLSASLGEDTLPKLARAHAGRLVPFLDERTASQVTGASYTTRWREWRLGERRVAEEFRAARTALGLTVSRALTTRGIEQRGARFSPDGSQLAYLSRALNRRAELRVMDSDGQNDRAVAEWRGGRGLSFGPDGRTLVYDEREVRRWFRRQGDLRVLDLESGRRRWLTHGARAQDPDLGPDGMTVVYVERHADRSELALVSLTDETRRTLTTSAPDTEWTRPRFSPDGRQVVAARLLPGGYSDLLLVDVATGALDPLTNDRAKDVEPAFTPDGRFVVFRSDRDGASNVYALALDDRRLLRVTNVLGGAFDPAVAPDGRTLVFSNYSASGYDVHVAALDLDRAPLAEPFVDDRPEVRPEPELADAPSRGYQPYDTLWPRFWVPYAERAGDQWRIGALTAGADVLWRHAWALELHHDQATGKLGGRGYYQYDRFRPTFVLSAEDVHDSLDQGALHTQNATLRASLPLVRRLTRSLDLGLAYRYERQTLAEASDSTPFELGGLELSLAYESARRHAFSISPTDGWSLRVAALREAQALGSRFDLTETYADGRIYLPLGAGHVLAARASGGASFGSPDFRSSYRIGGFPSGGLFDVGAGNLALLRGYPDDFERGRNFAALSLEYRLPLAHPQRGWRSAPLFLRHLHLAAFSDAAHAWSDAFAWNDVKRSAGLALGADVNLGHALPITGVLGVAKGFDEFGDTRVYARLGLAF